MRFVANLRSETITAFAAQDIQPAAYLLSSHRVSPSALEAAAQIRSQGIPLFADNGTKALIDDTVGLFEEPAREVRQAVNAIRRTLGHVPRGAEVPGTLRQQASDLADEVVRTAEKLSDGLDSDELLEVQLSMNPTDLIAQEDFGTACLIALDLERETTGWRVRRFDTRNRRSLRLWERVDRDPRCQTIQVHAVLSAMDYNTALSAGRIAAEAGVRHAALGIAGITLDPSAVDFFVMRFASLVLDRPVPRRYVRLAQILRGFSDGFAESNTSLESFHCLGLGSPAMLPIPATALSRETTISTDATSPIHDAARDRVLYDLERDGDRASTHEIVTRIVEGGDWPFLSPFTKMFRDEHGHDVARAQAFWIAQGRPPITASSLEAQNELTDALPLFSDADAELRLIAQRTRIAHNHWALGKIAADFQGNRRREQALAAIDRLTAGPSTVTKRGLEAARRIICAE